jgi:SpoVK/Ycf46/Vps4 family AAA+-type ATPase
MVVCGPDGSIEAPHDAAASWNLPVPCASARCALWASALGGRAPGGLADQLSTDHRHGTGRIAHLGRLARHHAAMAGRAAPNRQDVVAAALIDESSGLDALAQPLRVSVPDDALVAEAALRDDLEALMQRCRLRDDLTEKLGASSRTRYRPGVRALFIGPSGTGKTLAAGWMATRLGLPLYRVDLASITSKYIGETEKNLSQLLARAEQAEIILLFDEADSLFGKRTEVSDANDRFANAQTNYLLQRIETYDGIVLLTSNSQARFDEAFARRLDFVIEFPAPGPAERRALWESHLGPHTLTSSELNRLAVLVDLSGGHTRNAVLAAAVRARHARREIEFADVLSGIEAEFRKLGRQVPVELNPKR